MALINNCRILFLKGQQPLTERPGEYLKPVDFDEIREQLQDKIMVK